MTNIRTIFLLLLSVTSLSADEFEGYLKGLSGGNHAEQTQARNSLKFAFANAEGLERSNFENDVIKQVGVGLPIEHRLYMIRLLEWFGSADAVPVLTELLNDSEEEVRDSALRALSSIDGDEASFAIGNALRNASAEEAPAYIGALAYRKEPRAIGLISGFLESGNGPTAGAAAVALMRIGSTEALPALLEAWRQGSDAEPELERAILSLGPDASVAKELFEVSNDPAIRIQAFNGLLERDNGDAESIFKSLLDNGPSPGRSQIIGIALVEGNEGMRSYAVDRLATSSVADQILIVTAIGEAGLDSYESEVIEVMLSSQDDRLKQSCIEVLGKIGSDQSFDPIFQAMLADSKNTVVLNALSRLDAPSADEKAIENLRNDSLPVSDRVASMRLMELRNSPGALEVLNGIANDRSAPKEIREAAFKTLETIGNFDTVEIFVSSINEGGAGLRQAQLSLKRLSVNLRAPKELWTSYFKPAIENAPGDEVRERFIAILDGVGSKEAVDYLTVHITDPESPLQEPSRRSLSRWSNSLSVPAWVEIAKTLPDERENSIKQIRRVVEGANLPATERIDSLIKAVNDSPDAEFKLALLEALSPPPKNSGWVLRSRLPRLKNDPDVSDRVEEILASI
ncbi:MAG: HEAT repeat domain-containing protein [Verrucomicrobiota bacterium]